jgi:hypothetical protein
MRNGFVSGINDRGEMNFEYYHHILLNKLMISEAYDDRILLRVFRVEYEIIASPLYGWNFKCADSRHVIRYSLNREELIDYAESYCGTHFSTLKIYDGSGEIERTVNFENEI